MARGKSIKTRHLGVFRLEGQPNQFRVRGMVTNPKTGAQTSLDKIIEATSERAASKRRAELLEALEADQPALDERLRLSAYAASWMRSKLPSLKASTRSLYATMLDHYILPALGDHYVDAITSDDISRWRDEQAAMRVVRHGKERATSAETVNGRMRVLKQVLRDAVDDLGLAKDPTRRVANLRTATLGNDEEVDGAEGTSKSITAQQLAVLLETMQATSPEWYPFFYLLAFTGLRFGEASALKWGDLDKEAGKLWVRRAQWKGVVDTTKTASAKRGSKRTGVRSVPLFAELVEVLEGHRVAQRKAMVKRLRRERVPNVEVAAEAALGDWMFPAQRRKGNKLMHATAPAKPLRAAIAAAADELAKRGLAPIAVESFTVHGFRHTFNNLVRQAATGEGQGIVVRAMTGHATEEMTEHYSHVSVAEKAAVVGRVVQLVRSEK